MIKRADITGFTLKIGHLFIEAVFNKGILKVIAFNWKTLTGRTFRLIDFK